MSMDKKKVLTLEEAFSQLDQLIETLEGKDISLEDSFNKYQQGIKLLKICNEKIDTVEKKMLQLNSNGETNEF